MKRKIKRRAGLTPDEKAALNAVLNRPWRFWGKEYLRRAKREERLIPFNDRRQQKAATDYKYFQALARNLIARNPNLRNASHSHLAQRVCRELKQAGRNVSKRTIERALHNPKK